MAAGNKRVQKYGYVGGNPQICSQVSVCSSHYYIIGYVVGYLVTALQLDGVVYAADLCLPDRKCLRSVIRTDSRVFSGAEISTGYDFLQKFLSAIANRAILWYTEITKSVWIFLSFRLTFRHTPCDGCMVFF